MPEDAAPEDVTPATEAAAVEATPTWLERCLTPKPGRPQYYLTRWVFLRFLGVIYLVAFLSYWAQVKGLIGSNGILPAEGLVQLIKANIGAKGFWLAPSLFWLYPHDAGLDILCGGGVLAALLLIVGIAPALCLALLWFLYLSLVTVSQDFLSFQWDSLLLETGFMAIFFAPFSLWPRLAKEASPSRVVLWLLRWVLFRLIFGSGIVKIGDAAWDNFTALAFHYETQPLPTPVAWYAIQAPLWFQELSVLVVFVSELFVPLLIFAPRKLRAVGCIALVVFQLLIILTGNFAFFNWLTIALCVLLLDDGYLRRLIPKRLVALFRCPDAEPIQRLYKAVAAGVLVAFVAVLSSMQIVRLVNRQAQPPAPLLPVVRALEPFRLVNPYGLFAVMTTIRPEIIIEGSNDGESWLAYEFKWKPGDVHRAPAFVAPHQPRLDWQMWFAALGSSDMAPWFQNLMVRLLQGKPEVLDLLGHNPFPNSPPKYLRAKLHYYHFTRYEYGKTPDAWWTREEIAPYFSQVSLGAGKR